MDDTLIKPDIVLVTKNVMVPLALPVPENKFFLASRSSRKTTTIVRARKPRLSPGRAVRSGENAMLRTNVELLRSSDYLACYYDSLVDWEQDLHKNYELYGKRLALREAGFGDSRSEGNQRLDYLSQTVPERCKTFSLINDKKDRNTDETEEKTMLLGVSRRSGIEFGEEKNDLRISMKQQNFNNNESFNDCGREHTHDDNETKRNKKQKSLSRNFAENCKTLPSTSDEKDKISDGEKGKEMLFGGSRKTGFDLGEEKYDLGISTTGRDYEESFNRYGKSRTSGDTQIKGNKKQRCSSLNFAEHCKTFSSTNDEKDKISDEAEGKEILFGDSREGNVVWRQTGTDLEEEKDDLGISTTRRYYNESFNRCEKERTSGETETEGNKKQNCFSRNIPEHWKTSSSTNDGKDRNSDEAGGKEMLFVSRQIGIDLEEKKDDLGISMMKRDYNESFNRCEKEHRFDETEPKGTKKQNCLSQSFPEHCKTFSLKNDEKDKISDETERKKMLFGGFERNEIDLREEKNNLGISTSGRDYGESFNRCGKGGTLDVAISGATEAEKSKKQNCLSQSFRAHSNAATIGTTFFKPSLLSDLKDNGKEETARKEITSDEPTENELKIFDSNIRWKSRESSTTELRRCASSAASIERSKFFGKEADKGPKLNECEIKYSWQDLDNWVPPSAKKRNAEIDERSNLTGAKKLDCKIKYSWQIIGTGAQTSYELIKSLLKSAEEGEEKRAEKAANYPCVVKYSWQIIGTGTQVSFRRGNDDSLPIDGDYWNGKIVKPRKRFAEGSRDGSGPKTGSRKILYSETTQTAIDESHQTELGDCRVKYSWQNLTKPYLEKIRRL